MVTWIGNSIERSTRPLMGRENREKGGESQEWPGENVRGTGTEKKGYKKGIIILLVTRATPSTPASLQ